MKLGRILQRTSPTLTAARPTLAEPIALDRFTRTLGTPPPTPAPTQRAKTAAYDPGNLDPSTRPQDDFFQYAVGGYLAKNPIPDDQAAWGVGGVVAQRTQENLRGILEDLASKPQENGSIEQKLATFYQSGMDEAAIEKAGLRPLSCAMSHISDVSSIWGLQIGLAHMHITGYDCLFNFSASPDLKNPGQVIGEVSQGGLGMPSREYYLQQDDDSKKTRDAYVTHVTNMFGLLGYPPAKAQKAAADVMDIETQLAQAHLPADQMRDPHQLYHPTDREGLAKLTPNFSWGIYTSNTGLNNIKSLNVVTPQFFQKIDQMLVSVPLDAWKNYFRWQVLHQTAPYLPARFEKESFAFESGVLRGVVSAPPRWKTVVANSDVLMGQMLGQKYVEKYFPAPAKAQAADMIEKLRDVLRDKVQHGWMSEPTRAEALAKVDTLRVKVGYPDQWKDYSDLWFLPRTVYAENVQQIKQYERIKMFGSVGHAVDPQEWPMTPATVNAHYDATRNEICIPAGFLQPPYFDTNGDAAANYGATGAAIGHELTHGFDDQGSQFDAQGKMRDWWQPQDRAAFQQRADGVIRQFDEFSYQGQPVHGSLVVGESIADLGGLELAQAAFDKAVPNRDRAAAQQNFYLSYAMSWATSLRPQMAKLLLAADSHPLPQFRVNGPLANLAGFHQAFACQPNDPMVRPEDKRNRFWD